MNFLAHLYLSDNDEELLIGNFIADSVKGSAFRNFSPGIANGILLHREIDRFTDAHPIVRQSIARIRPVYRKFSGVIIDIFYDHFLAANWKDFSSVPLTEFAQDVLRLMQQHEPIMPYKSKMFLAYTAKHNPLVGYSTVEGIEKVLTGMSKRTRFRSNMELSVRELKQHYDLFRQEFYAYFPELKLHAKNFISTLK